MANVFETAESAGTFTHFVQHVKAAGLESKLTGAGPVTVFAPTDEAVAKLSAETLSAVSGDAGLLTKIVSYHILEGNYTSTDLEGLSTITTLLGEDVSVNVADGEKIKIDGAHLTTPGHAAGNGTLYAIDTVLVPEAAALALQS